MDYPGPLLPTQSAVDSYFQEINGCECAFDLTDLVESNEFVDTIFHTDAEHENDWFYAPMDTDTDMMHDHFHLNTRQRRHVANGLIDQAHKLYDPYTEFMAFEPATPGHNPAPSTAPMPEVKGNTVETRAGPYPTGP